MEVTWAPKANPRGKEVEGEGVPWAPKANPRQHQMGSTWAPKANPRGREEVVEGVGVELVIIPGPRRLAEGWCVQYPLASLSSSFCYSILFRARQALTHEIGQGARGLACFHALLGLLLLLLLQGQLLLQVRLLLQQLG